MGHSLEPVPQPAIRRLPLIPVGGWRWSWKSHRPTSTQATRETACSLTVARPRRMKRCGRAVLLWVLFWYAVVLTIPMVLKDRWQRIGAYNEARKWPALRQLVSQQPERPLLLMLGSSRGCWAFRAGCLDGMPDSAGRPMRVYNFGIPATGPIHQLFFLRQLLAEGIRPQFLLVEFLPPLMCEAQRGALTEEGMTGFETLSTHRFLEWWPYLHRPGKRARLWLEGRIAPWYAFRRQIQWELIALKEGRTLPPYHAIDEWGWSILSPAPLSAEVRAHNLETARGGYSPGLNQFHLGKKPTQAVRQVLDLCRRERIPAALVVMPESSAFRSWYSDEARKVLGDLLDELSKTYGVEVIDAQRWLADEDFEDGHHTLYHGADVFTSRLRAELPRLLSQSQAAKSD
jgi:hypothetical protein